MQIVHDEAHLQRAMAELAAAGTLGREGGLSAERPVLIDRFLDDATEIDVDAIRDASGEVLIGGVMEHVEEAGVHSGDSACAIPPPTLEPWVIEAVESYTRVIANALDVKGLLNVQFAVANNVAWSAEPKAPGMAPVSRKMRVSRRVSMPAIPLTPMFAR